MPLTTYLRVRRGLPRFRESLLIFWSSLSFPNRILIFFHRTDLSKTYSVHADTREYAQKVTSSIEEEACHNVFRHLLPSTAYRSMKSVNHANVRVIRTLNAVPFDLCHFR